MLSRDFSQITNKTCQSRHKTVPSHIDVIQLKPKNSLKQIHYLVKHEGILPIQKK